MTKDRKQQENQFSVAMCVYAGDNPHYFDEALYSVTVQSLQPFEIVLVVDGWISKEAEEVIEKYRALLEKQHIKFVVRYFEINMGHGMARRESLRLCSSDLVALMDADDISVKDRFERQIEYLVHHKDVHIVGGMIEEFVDLPENIVGKRVVPCENDLIIKYMQKRCPMNQVTVMFRKRDIEEVGGYIDWYCEEDYYLWIRMALAGKRFGNINNNLVKVRVDDKMYRRRGGVRYFLSEFRIQQFMLNRGMISLIRFCINISERFIIQILVPNSLRGYLFRKLARE